jgi:hypothetical protein
LYDKNKFSSILLTKRICDAFIILIIIIIIANLISAIFFIIVDPPHCMIGIHPCPMELEFERIKHHFLIILFPSMIISSISGIIFFTIINVILSKRLQILEATYIKKEYGYSEDLFKLLRNSIL